MTPEIHFTLDLEPVPKGRPRFTRAGHAYTPARTRLFERMVRTLALQYCPPRPLLGALRVTVRFFLRPPKKKTRELPTGRPDLDNLVKGVKDALNGVLWADDSQIVRSEQEKLYDWATRRARIEVSVEEVEPKSEAA